MGLLLLGLTACTPAAESTPETSPIPAPLTPYVSPTPTPARSPTPFTPPESAPPPPTPTPILYTIQAGDTLLGIAQRYNLKLDDLLAANPGVDPNFLIVGNELVIPAGEGGLAALPSPAAADVELGAPRCYPAAEGGLWCLLLAANDGETPLENVSAQITLYSPDGEQLASQSAPAPLNLLHPEARLPLAAYFPPSTPINAVPLASLQTALPLAVENERYLPLTLQVNEPQTGDLTVQVSGTVQLAGDVPATQIWLAVTALDSDDAPVGFRKWVAPQELNPGESLTFEVTVFSLGPPIVSVEVNAEARP